jgi:hypothetical protein
MEIFVIVTFPTLCFEKVPIRKNVNEKMPLSTGANLFLYHDFKSAGILQANPRPVRDGDGAVLAAAGLAPRHAVRVQAMEGPHRRPAVPSDAARGGGQLHSLAVPVRSRRKRQVGRHAFPGRARARCGRSPVVPGRADGLNESFLFSVAAVGNELCCRPSLRPPTTTTTHHSDLSVEVACERHSRRWRRPGRGRPKHRSEAVRGGARVVL